MVKVRGIIFFNTKLYKMNNLSKVRTLVILNFKRGSMTKYYPGGDICVGHFLSPYLGLKIMITGHVIWSDLEVTIEGIALTKILNAKIAENTYNKNDEEIKESLKKRGWV